MWQVFGVTHPEEIYTYRTLREYFKATLDKVAARLSYNKKLVILVDGVDHLPDAHGLSWLPESWPKHVHVVFTTDTAHRLSMRNLSNHIRHSVRRLPVADRLLVDECLMEISPLTGDEMDAIIDTELTRSSRALTVLQRLVRTFRITVVPRPSSCPHYL